MTCSQCRTTTMRVSSLYCVTVSATEQKYEPHTAVSQLTHKTNRSQNTGTKEIVALFSKQGDGISNM